jgi:hypothetical protein
MKKNASPSTETQDLRDLYKDERTEKKIQEHLTNENDIITEEDIANAPTGIAEGKELPRYDDLPTSESELSEQEQEKEEEMLKKKKIKDNEDLDVETPWNVLGE